VTRRAAILIGLLLLLTLVPLVALRMCKQPDAGIPEYGPVGEFSLRDQTGAAFGSAELRGKVWVAAFMFVRCPTICPVITARMKSLQEQAKERGIPLRLVSITVDPDNDTPEVLRAYASEKGADQSSWHFLTGDYDAIKKTSVQGFKTALEGKADAKKEHYGILHGSHLILLDKQNRLRGFYRTSDDAEMARLLEDAKKLQ
jgi:protein SCO1